MPKKLCNAHISPSKVCRPMPKMKSKLKRKFTLKEAQQMIYVRSQVASVNRRSSSRTQSCDSERLLNVGVHHPERPHDATRNNTYCVVCRERYQRYLRAHPGTAYKDNPFTQTKTVFRCSKCSAYLCIRENSNCWVDYHTKIEFWRQTMNTKAD